MHEGHVDEARHQAAHPARGGEDRSAAAQAQGGRGSRHAGRARELHEGEPARRGGKVSLPGVVFVFS